MSGELTNSSFKSHHTETSNSIENVVETLTLKALHMKIAEFENKRVDPDEVAHVDPPNLVYTIAL